MTHHFTEAETAAWIARQPKKAVAAKVIVKSDEGNILILKPAYKPGWQMPGGGVEAHEAPLDAAIRELREETGLEARPADFRLAGAAYHALHDALSLIYEYIPRLSENVALELPPTEIESAKFEAPAAVAAQLPTYYGDFWRQYLHA